MTTEKGKARIQQPEKPLRVLHITFNMGIGGTEQVIRQLVQGMAPDSIESEILCIDGQIGPIGEALQLSGIPVHKVARKHGFDWSVVAAIRLRLREGWFDVVHCHQYTPWNERSSRKVRIRTTEKNPGDLQRDCPAKTGQYRSAKGTR